MLLHLITYEVRYKGDADTETASGRYGIIVGSQKEAGQRRKSIRQTVGYVPNSVETARIDVPNAKSGLLKVLNLCLNKEYDQIRYQYSAD